MRLSKAQVFAFLFIVSILAAVPLTVIISQKQQDVRQRASGAYSCAKTYYRDSKACFDEDDPINTFAYESSSNETKPCDSKTPVDTQCAAKPISAPTSIPTSAPIPTQPPAPTNPPVPTTPRCSQRYGDDCGPNFEGYIDCYGTCVMPTVEPTSAPIPTNTPIPHPTSLPVPTNPVSLPTSVPTVIACPYRSKGDANCDNAVNLLDYLAWLNKSLGSSVDPSFNLDLDNSGAVDTRDYAIISNGLLDPSIPHSL